MSLSLKIVFCEVVNMNKINVNPNTFILLRLYYYNQLNKTKEVKMINALIFRLSSKPSSESIKLEVQHMQICTEIDYTTISNLHKLIDKWLSQSVQSSCNSLDAFKPVFKIGFFTLILIASLKRRIFQFLWRSIILGFICTKSMQDVLRSCTLSTILSENNDGVNLVILNISCTP